MGFNSKWLGNADAATRQRLERAMNTGSEAAGNLLMQQFINRTVQLLTLREFGLQSFLDRRPGSGNAVYVNRRTPSVSGTTGGGEWYADTGTVADETGNYSQVSFGFKTLATRGQITRKLIAQGRTYADVMGIELAAKAEDYANAMENALFLGNLTGAETNRPVGFLSLVQNPGGTWSDEQTVNNNAAGLTSTETTSLVLSQLDEAIDRVKGAGNRSDLAIVGSFSGIRAVNAVLQQYQQFVNTVEIAAGFRVRTYDGIPLIVSTSMPNSLTFGGSGEIAGNAGTGTGLLVVNKRYNYIAELTPTTVLPLARTTSQNESFDIFSDVTFVNENPKGIAFLSNLTPG